MSDDNSELDRLQADYKAAVDTWVSAIRAEEALASVHHTVAEVDEWEKRALPGRRSPRPCGGREDRLLRARCGRAFFGFD